MDKPHDINNCINSVPCWDCENTTMANREYIIKFTGYLPVYANTEAEAEATFMALRNAPDDMRKQIGEEGLSVGEILEITTDTE